MATKKEMFMDAINYVEGKAIQTSKEEIIACLTHEIELLDRKASTPRKPTTTQVENETLKEAIVDYLREVDKPRTIKEMQADLECLAGLSNQRITHLLTALRDAKVVTRSYVKKVAYFSPGAEED